MLYPLDPGTSQCVSGMTGNVHPEAAVRVIQSMARFMAAYFTNQLLCILPPHNVNILPPLHIKTGNIVNNFLTLFCTVCLKSHCTVIIILWK